MERKERKEAMATKAKQAERKKLLDAIQVRELTLVMLCGTLCVCVCVCVCACACMPFALHEVSGHPPRQRNVPGG